MDLQLPCIFFLKPLHHVSLLFPRAIVLSLIGIAILVTLAVLFATVYGLLRRRKKNFAKYLEEKYGINRNEDDIDDDE